VGIIKKELKELKTDLDWFKTKAASLKKDQHDNTCRLQDRGKGYYNLEFACLHWAGINIEHINHLINLLQEVLHCHYQAVGLEEKGELMLEKLKKAVVDKLCWNDKQLPQAFAFNPEL
ncbi:hypothetical protein FRB95_005077, partial [Tulasnella sp. JGI-2019a]